MKGSPVRIRASALGKPWLPDGRQVQKKLGSAWTKRGRPADGYFTKQTAQTQLDQILDEIRRGQHAGMVRTGATFQQAADEYLRYIEQDRARKPSTVAGYRALVRAQLLPAFGVLPVESITTQMVESWITGSRSPQPPVPRPTC